jgi:prophage regulatory protein
MHPVLIKKLKGKRMKNEILLRKPVVLERTGMTNSTLYYFINEGNFPKPVKLGKRTVAWKKSEIDEWIDGLERSMSEGEKNDL